MRTQRIVRADQAKQSSTQGSARIADELGECFEVIFALDVLAQCEETAGQNQRGKGLQRLVIAQDLVWEKALAVVVLEGAMLWFAEGTEAVEKVLDSDMALGVGREGLAQSLWSRQQIGVVVVMVFSLAADAAILGTVPADEGQRVFVLTSQGRGIAEECGHRDTPQESLRTARLSWTLERRRRSTVRREGGAYSTTRRAAYQAREGTDQRDVDGADAEGRGGEGGHKDDEVAISVP